MEENERIIAEKDGYENRFSDLPDDVVVGVDNVSNLWKMFHSILIEIIKRIESEAGVKGNVHIEVHEFANKMIEMCTSSHGEIMTSHLALLTEQDRLLFLLKIKYMFHRNRGYFVGGDYDYEDWRNELVAAKNFGGMHEFLRTWHDPKKDCEFHVKYLYFIYNCYEHVKQRTSTCKLYCMENFGKDIGNVHPAFASYVFNRYV